MPARELPELKLKVGQPALGAALKVAKDLQLFEKWHERDDEAVTSEQLAEVVSCDPVLLGQSRTSHGAASSSNLSVDHGSLVSMHTGRRRKLIVIEGKVRLLRHLAANHMLQEISIGVFKPTAFTLALLQPVFGEWINYLYATPQPTKNAAYY